MLFLAKLTGLILKETFVLELLLFYDLESCDILSGKDKLQQKLFYFENRYTADATECFKNILLKRLCEALVMNNLVSQRQDVHAMHRVVMRWGHKQTSTEIVLFWKQSICT